MKNKSVLQDWVNGLTLMQQTVLITALRGPDGIEKNHVAKLLLRWLRRCILISAFDGKVFEFPYGEGGGSFMGPSIRISDHNLDNWPLITNDLLYDYLRSVDELPHHFQLHFMHAIEIVGYKHPNPNIRGWWNHAYLEIVNDLHLFPEPEDVMDKRLGDNEHNWRVAEVVTAGNP